MFKLFPLLGLFVPALSFASYDLFHPIADSDSDYMINYILKPVFGYAQSVDQVNPFATISSVFLSGLMIVAAILLCYGWFVSMHNTAQTGYLMGTQHGGSKLTYLTLRTTLGLGMLMPLGKAGISAIQYIVLWCAAQGILFANLTWEGFASNPTLGTLTYSTQIKRTAFETASKIFISELCVALGDDGTEVNGDEYKWKKESSSNGVINYGKRSWGRFGKECGTVSIQKPKLISQNTCKEQTDDFGDLSMMGNCLSEHNQAIETANIDTQVKILESWTSEGNIWEKLARNTIQRQSEIDSLSLEDGDQATKRFELEQDLRLNLLSTFQAELNKYKSEVEKAIESKTTDLSKETQERFQNAMVKHGFASIGSWYFKLAKELSEQSKAANVAVKISYTNPIFDIPANNWSGVNSAKLSKNMIEKLNKMSEHILPVAQHIDLSPNKNEDNAFDYSAIADQVKKTGGIKEEDDIQKMATNTMNNLLPVVDVKNSTLAMLGGQKSMIGSNALDILGREDSSVNPILTIKKWGDTLLNWATGGFLAALILYAGGPIAGAVVGAAGGAAIGASGGTISSAFGALLGGLGGAVVGKLAGGALVAIGVIIQTIAGLFLIPALMMAFYFPLMPFLIWVGALFGWVVMLVEALFGAPMWAVTFLSPDIDGLVGKLGQGYKLILGLVLRPALMVIGFVASLHLLAPVMDFTNYFFAMAIESIWDSTGWVASVFVYFAIVITYCIVYNKTAIQIFQLIYKLPDNLLTWIGGIGGQLQGYASGVESAVGGATQAAMGAAPQVLKNTQDATKEIGKTVGQGVKQLSSGLGFSEAERLQNSVSNNPLLQKGFQDIDAINTTADIAKSQNEQAIVRNSPDVKTKEGMDFTKDQVNQGNSLIDSAKRDALEQELQKIDYAIDNDPNIKDNDKDTLKKVARDRAYNGMKNTPEKVKQAIVNGISGVKFYGSGYSANTGSTNTTSSGFSSNPFTGETKVNQNGGMQPTFNEAAKLNLNDYSDIGIVTSNEQEMGVPQDYGQALPELNSKTPTPEFEEKAGQVADNITSAVNSVDTYDPVVVSFARTPNGLEEKAQWNKPTWQSVQNRKDFKKDFAQALAQNGNNNVIKAFKNQAEYENFKAKHNVEGSNKSSGSFGSAQNAKAKLV